MTEPASVVPLSRRAGEIPQAEPAAQGRRDEAEAPPQPFNGQDTAGGPKMLSAPADDVGSSPAAELHSPAAGDLSTWQRSVALERLHALQRAWPLIAVGANIADVARAAGCSVSTMCNLLSLSRVGRGALRPDAHRIAQAERLLTGDLSLLAPPAPRGTRSEWATLLDLPAIAGRLRELYIATLRSSCERTQIDRRTGAMLSAMKRWSFEPECPPALRERLRAGRVPEPFRRFFRRITPEVEALIRGEKHFQLHGFSGRRTQTIGLPDGRQAYLPAGWLWELDDMSVNQPFWFDGPDGPQLSRQGIYARDHRSGRWLGVELIGRTREAYTAADILRAIRRLCQLLGKPREIRIERGIWAARALTGWRITEQGATEEMCERPPMAVEQRAALQRGLEAAGIAVTWCRSAHGKAALESSFNTLQTWLAMETTEFNNIGRHAGEFERPAKQLRRARAGSHHPALVGFAHQEELRDRIITVFSRLNALPRGRDQVAPDEIWNRDVTRWPLRVLDHNDLAAFLPECRERRVTGGAVYPTVDGREFGFRALKFAEIGDGQRVIVRFDPLEPALGAAIYNGRGDLLCWAQYDPPAPTTTAAVVPEDLPTFSEIELLGGQADGGVLLRQQRAWARRQVSSTFGAALPGQPGARPSAAAPASDADADEHKSPRALRIAPRPRAEPPRREVVESRPDPRLADFIDTD